MCVCEIARETVFLLDLCVWYVFTDILRPQKNQFLVQGLTEWTNLNHVSVGLLFCTKHTQRWNFQLLNSAKIWSTVEAKQLRLNSAKRKMHVKGRWSWYAKWNARDLALAVVDFIRDGKRTYYTSVVISD